MNGIFRQTIYVMLIVSLLLTACSDNAVMSESSAAGNASSTQPVYSSSLSSASQAEPEQQIELHSTYINQLAEQTVAKLIQPGMGEYEMAKSAFDYMIQTMTLADPVGLDLWRIRAENQPQPSFIENRALSIFLFNVGMCEDYASALTLLLREMGMEAQYIPGLTYAANGSGFVDHAWTAAKIDGVWYHLDVQLEQNVTRREKIMYKYFMKSDAYMSGSHRWGQNLIDSRLLTHGQNAEIERDFLHPECPEDYPTPEPHTFIPTPKQDVSALKSSIAAEIREYENLHGALPPLELNIIPPVFGTEGYGAE